MESETMILQSVTIPPALPPKTKQRTTISHQMSSSETGSFESDAMRYSVVDSARPDSGTAQSSTPASSSQSALASSSLIGVSSRSTQSTVFLAANADHYNNAPTSVHQPPQNGHVVTIRINPTDNNQQQNNNNTTLSNSQPLIVNNGSMDGVTTFKGNTKVSLNQTSPINTIGKFIVNICENGERNNRVIEESSYTINNKETTTTPLNGCVRISVGSTESNNTKNEKNSMVQKTEGLIKPTSNGDMGSPYFFCNPFPCSPTNLMSSGQCSPSDTLDSGTCSDLDGTPPPLPKKKLSKSNGTGHKRVSVTVIGATTHDRAPSVTSSGAEVDSEDSESNISCDSLNSSELSSASLHEDTAAVTFKSEILKTSSSLSSAVKPPVVVDGMPCAPKMPTFLNNPKTSSGFLPQGLLQDIRDRSAKLSSVVPPEQVKTSWAEIEKRVDLLPVIKKEIAIKPEEKLTSFKLVSQINTGNRKPRPNEVSSTPIIIDTTPAFPKIVDTIPVYTKVIPIVNESTYVDRKLEQEKQKQDQLYSGNFLYDTDKYYNFHLNENVFDNEISDNDKKIKKKNGVSVNGKSVCSSSSDSEYMDEESMEYFAGYKDYKNEDGPAAIRSAKGTIRGVKNRVRAGIATFLQMQNTSAKSYKEKDAGKIVFYTTSMGIVRDTYQKCVLVKKILRNLLVKFEERDVFMSMEYQEEIKDRMHTSDVIVPQLFVDGQYIGGAETVEILNEAGELRRMLKPYKSADACTTCQMCGGYRLLPCQVCSGSKKSVHRNHFTAEFVALKCMNCDEVGLVKCEAC